MKTNNTCILTLAAMSLFAAPAAASLITSTWAGGPSGNWNVAGNWSPSGVPNNGANTFDVIIDGNSLQTASVTLNMSATVDSLTINAADALSIANNMDLRVVGSSLVNNGLMTIDAIGNYTHLYVGSNVTISGSGELALGSNDHNRIGGTAYGNRLTNGSSHTISGGGQLGMDVIVLTNNGLLDARQAVEMLVDLNAGATSYNTGTMQASNGGTLHLYGSAIDNTGGLVQALNDSVVLMQAATLTGGEVSSTGTGELQTAGNATYTSILNSGTIHAANNSDTYFGGTITNNGVIGMTGAANYTQLYIASPNTVFDGNGEIRLGNNDHNRIGGAAYGYRLVNSAQHTIRGAGQLGMDAIVLTNDGTIDADQSVAMLIDLNAGATSDNTGTMQASNGGTLHLYASAIDNTGGLVQALNNSVVLMQAATLTGGEISATGTGVFQTVSNATYNDLLNSGYILAANNSDTFFGGTITNNGVIEMAGAANYTQLYIASPNTVFDGTGEIVLGNNDHNRIGGGAYDYRLVNSAQHTIRGAGQLGMDVIVLTNDGLIDADQSVQMLVDLHGSATNSNTGTMQASGGGTLHLYASVIDNTGGLIQALDSSAVLVHSSTIRAGELTSAGTGEFRFVGDAQVDDLLTSANIVCINNTNSYLHNTITNNGTILVDAVANFTQLVLGTPTVTLAGDNTLILGNSSLNRITGATFDYRLVNGPAHTIRGAGQIGADIINLTNQGAIIADLSAGMTIDPHGDFLNQGTLQVTGAGGMTINPGTFSNSGQVTIDATRTLTRHQHYSQTGGETLVNGTLAMASSGTLQLQGGTLKGTGTVFGPVSNIGGVVDPGASVGTLNVNGTYAQSATGTLRVEISGSASGESDLLSVSSSASLAGAIQIVPVGGFTPALGNAFTILTASSITGKFDAVNGNGMYCVSYSPTAVTVTVISTCSADVTCDHQVGVADLLAVINDWGPCAACPSAHCIADIAPAGPPQGDCQVNVADLLAVISAWGACP